MKPNLRTVVSAGCGIVLLTLLLLVGIVAFPGLVGGDDAFVVTSGSMSPTVEPGDVVITREPSPEEVQVGDVVTISDGAGTDAGYVTHRVVEVVEDDGDRYYSLQGDANENPDEGLAPAEYVQGVQHLHLPYLGHLLLFARSSLGLLAFVVVPGLALVVSGCWQLLRELGVIPDGDCPLEGPVGPDGDPIGDGGTIDPEPDGASTDGRGER